MCSLCKVLLKIQIHVRNLNTESIFRTSRKVSVEYMNAEKRFWPKIVLKEKKNDFGTQ